MILEIVESPFRECPSTSEVLVDRSTDKMPRESESESEYFSRVIDALQYERGIDASSRMHVPQATGLPVPIN